MRLRKANQNHSPRSFVSPFKSEVPQGRAVTSNFKHGLFDKSSCLHLKESAPQHATSTPDNLDFDHKLLLCSNAPETV